MNRFLKNVSTPLLFGSLLIGSMAGQNPSKSPPANSATADYSGMYSFLTDGEFVQITIEDEGQVTGFVSRYGDLQGDHRAFIDHFFKRGKIEGRKLTFTTELAQNVSYEFSGTVERGDGKTPADEAFYVLRGTLVQNSLDSNHKMQSKSQPVTFKSFPQEAEDSK